MARLARIPRGPAGRVVRPGGMITSPLRGPHLSPLGPNIANPVPNAGNVEWSESPAGTWTCTGNNVGAATTLILSQGTDGVETGKTYEISATIVGTADILIRSGSTTLNTNWDGTPTQFTATTTNFNIFQRAGGYAISAITVREVL